MAKLIGDKQDDPDKDNPPLLLLLAPPKDEDDDEDEDEDDDDDDNEPIGDTVDTRSGWPVEVVLTLVLIVGSLSEPGSVT